MIRRLLSFPKVVAFPKAVGVAAPFSSASSDEVLDEPFHASNSNKTYSHNLDASQDLEKMKQNIYVSLKLLGTSQDLNGSTNFLRLDTFSKISSNLAPSIVTIIARRTFGSGFIVDSSGTIMTCAHVVDGVTKVRVTLSDHSELNGIVTHSDSFLDIALVQVKDDNHLFVPVKLGFSGKLLVGDLVMCAGSPYSLPNTFALGVISCLHRPIRYESLHLLQTDCATGPGGSGSPLVDLLGEAIGVISAGAAPGIACAVPMDTIRKMFTAPYTSCVVNDG